MSDKFNINVVGDVAIFETNNGIIGKKLLEKKNAIHPKNMAIAIARGLSNSANHQIFKIKLGNQGTYIDANQQIVFRPPNINEDADDLYNATYTEIVDESNTGSGVGNSVTYTTIPNSANSRVIVTATISANEAVNRPSDESDSANPYPDPEVDGSIDPEGEYFFDELGLFTSGVDEGTTALLDSSTELMLSHLVFSPIEHTGSRELTVVYSLTVSVS